MKMDQSYLKACPRRRDEGLIVREVGEEVVVYDLDRHEAHCLNPEAAAIWNACDGSSNGRTILEVIHGNRFGREQEVAYLVGLRELEDKHLLDEVSGFCSRTSRRELLARLGKAAAVTIALPTVISIVSPTAAEADSCLASGAACSSSAQCCSGLCRPGSPSGSCA